MDSKRLEQLGVRVPERPNVLAYENSDDAADAVGAYGVALERTIDELAAEVERLRETRVMPKSIKWRTFGGDEVTFQCAKCGKQIVLALDGLCDACYGTGVRP